MKHQQTRLSPIWQSNRFERTISQSHFATSKSQRNTATLPGVGSCRPAIPVGQIDRAQGTMIEKSLSPDVPNGLFSCLQLAPLDGSWLVVLGDDVLRNRVVSNTFSAVIYSFNTPYYYE